MRSGRSEPSGWGTIVELTLGFGIAAGGDGNDGGNW